MKSVLSSRVTALRALVALLVLLSGVSAWVSASSLPKSGYTGQALAARALLHPAVTKAAAERFQKAMSRWQTAANGRYLQPNASPFAAPKPMLPASNPSTISISEGVQTFDLQAAPPNFAPADGALVYQNLTPVWSASETFVVFSSNRPSNVAGDPAGHFHIWAISSRGDVPGATTLSQVTSGTGNEFFPALDNNSVNNELAFTSDANSPNDQNLYIIGGQTGVPFVPGQAPIDVRTLATLPASAKTLSAQNLLNVTRSTFSPGSDRIAFSATTPTGQSGLTGGRQHIFFLNVSNNGFLAQPAPGQANPPAQLTDGPANDADPAWSPDGSDIIYDSNATDFVNSGNQLSPTTAPAISQGVKGSGSRSLFLISGNAAAAFGTVANGGAQVDTTGFDDYGPAWSFNQPNVYYNPNNTLEYISFARAFNNKSNHDIYYFQLTQQNADQTVTIQPENSVLASGATNNALYLNTDDPGNKFDDTYPSWSPFQSIFSIVYQSPRSVTYNQANNLPSETAINLPLGTRGVGNGYTGLLESQVINLDPPSLLRFNGNEVIRVTDAQGHPTRNLQPSTLNGKASIAKFIVRLSNREAGIDDNKVFLQIKDPDSKYQDSQRLEHKVLAGTNDEAPDPNPNNAGQFIPLDSGTAAILAPGFGNSGTLGGIDTTTNPHTPILIGHGVGEAQTATSQGRAVSPDFGPTGFIPWGPEYECQYVNPTVLNPSTNPGDYGVPYYLAGIDDDQPFSGDVQTPRPTTNDPTQANPLNQFAQWLQLTRLPDAQQDGQGGVLYGASYQTPASPSDFYLDVIAYDKAVFPAIPAGSSQYVGRSINFRIYDNVGGFTTATFDGANDVLVVADNALGQKFSFTNFGQNGNTNLIPSLFGAESYYTDVDIDLLPTSVISNVTLTQPTVPNIPAAAATATPTQLSATPGNGSVTLVWAGTLPAPTQYNIYRSTTPGGENAGPGGTPIATVAGNFPTTYLDRGLINGVTYYYEVTALNGTNETGPSNEASATPEDFGTSTRVHQKLSALGDQGLDVENGLGVNSYLDGVIDDGGRLTADAQAGLPSGSATVPFVRPQKYSIWRILSRGAIPASVLGGYQPQFQAQPAVADPTTGARANAESVPVANRCVIWVSPYTGDLPLVDAGSLENPTTQTLLTNFVNAGGRLCITGQNVASSISLRGTADPNSANIQFLNKLGVTYASRGGGGQVLSGNGQRVSGFSGGAVPNFPMLFGGNFLGITDPVRPSSNALILSNAFLFPPQSDLGRRDASFDQTNNSLRGSVARIDTVNPVGNDVTDMLTNGQAGLVYHSDYTSAVGSGYGSRVVFGSFGLEGLGIEYYCVRVNPNIPFYGALNQRPHILHNIVNFLRTGTFTGRITQANGQGVPGATVYVQGGPPVGGIPDPRGLFSATTGFDGSYTINGVEPGTYGVTAYKQGFTGASSNFAFDVEGDTIINGLNLVIAPVPPGRITGKVTDVNGTGVGSITVTFVSTDQQTTLTAVTGPDGTYTIDNVPAGSYNGTTAATTQYSGAAAPTQGNPITVPSGGSAQADFQITAVPAIVSGVVFNDKNSNNRPDNGEGIAGATLTFTPATGAAPAPVTSGAGGKYSINLQPGTYTITVVATGFLTSNTQTVVVQAGQKLTRNIPLVPTPVIQPGTLGGLVTDSFSGKALSGATVTIKDANGNTVATVTTGTASSPGAPKGDGQPLNYGPVSLPPGNYSVTVTDGGFSTQSVASVSVRSSAFTRVDFTSANGNPLTPIHVFGAGYNFFSVPYDYAAAGISFNQLFGPLNLGTFSPFKPNPSNANRSHVFVWNPVLVQYVLDPAPPADGPHLGQGYWVFLHSPSEVTVAGNAPTTATIPVGLQRGWNQIGVPSLTAITTGRLSFANPAGGAAITFANATGSTYHLVSPTLYGYNGSSYFTVTAASQMQPWQSYWIYAFADTTIEIPTGGG